MTTFIQNPSQSLQIKPVAGRIGAEIFGLKLGADLRQEQFDQIYQALLEYKVIFFRDQHHLTDQDQEIFAQRFGTPVKHPTVPSIEGTDYILELDSQKGARANSWHTDVTFIDAYPKISLLRGVVIPEAGGDTIWANTESAYDNLSEELKVLAEKLTAVHSNDYDYAKTLQNVSAETLKRFHKVFTATQYETEHPVVIVHPETAKKSLLLGHFFKQFVGYNQQDSASLFHLLQSKVTRLENTVRWKWQVGDLVIWDNRATQHYAINDYGDAHRVVHRVTVAGEVSIGANGKKGRTTIPDHLSSEAFEQAKINAVLGSN